MTLLQLMLCFWKNKAFTDFYAWFAAQTRDSKEDKQKVLAAGKVAIKYAMKASWGDWDGGSSIFFWLWPPKLFEEAYFGLPSRFVAEPTKSKDRQRPNTDPRTEVLMKKKVKKVINSEYIKCMSADLILSLMYFFLVRKGEINIWMVCDGSKSGLNTAIWAP